ncbi:MAG: DUF559 domain-containing protein, partial [Acidobacteria bacterium]
MLWSRLRGQQLRVHFRREDPIGSFIADFSAEVTTSVSR